MIEDTGLAGYHEKGLNCRNQ